MCASEIFQSLADRLKEVTGEELSDERFLGFAACGQKSLKLIGGGRGYDLYAPLAEDLDGAGVVGPGLKDQLAHVLRGKFL